jgi:thiol-disulfide isomerase/thioredoxin
MGTMRLWRRLPFGLLALAAAIAIAACGSDDGGSDEAAQPVEPVVTEAPAKGAPKALAQNRAEASQIIDGSTEALEAKLAELHGHPVVVNQWGSWCPPCRAEFPFFAETAEAHAADVAFVGVDIQDDRGAAEEFLEEFPVPYPSIYDRDADAVFALNWSGVSPTTWFVDEQGEVVHQRPGAYQDREALEADIESFLLRG